MVKACPVHAATGGLGNDRNRTANPLPPVATVRMASPSPLVRSTGRRWVRLVPASLHDLVSPGLPTPERVVFVCTHNSAHSGEQRGRQPSPVGGLVVGLFAPPLLLSTAIGAGIGAAIGGLVNKHEEKELGVELDEYLPPGSSAIVAVVDDLYLDRLASTIGKADKRVSKAIDSGDYDKVKKAVQSADQITDSLES